MPQKNPVVRTNESAADIRTTPGAKELSASPLHPKKPEKVTQKAMKKNRQEKTYSIMSPAVFMTFLSFPSRSKCIPEAGKKQARRGREDNT